MGKLVKLLSLCALFLVHGCATVKQPEVRIIDDKLPQISKAVAIEEKSSKTGLKRKVAIARFSNETKYGQSFFLDKDNDRIGKQAVDILSSKLLETDKFILLERADLEKINKELSMENYSPLKNMADYLIIGSVTEFGRKDTGEVGIFSRTKKQTASAKVTVRLVDVYNGQIIYSEEGQGEAFSEVGTVFGAGAQAGYDTTLNDKALGAAITNLSSNIIENLLNKPWRGFILAHEDNSLIISGGTSQNINPGDMFDVIQNGKKIKNPQTNMYITLPGKKVAIIKAISSTGDNPANEVTFCEILDGDLSTYIAEGNFTNLHIREIQ
ncbi:MAG: curli production assembly protein CsgG [Nitrospira sp.]|nr:curli production assembly protein CsgG [bacterium]MBL7049728.1 curli production assembly protein CsgG [Nitrospira sp.]